MALSSAIGLIYQLHAPKPTSGNQIHTKIVERLEMTLGEKRQPIANNTYQLQELSQPRGPKPYDWPPVVLAPLATAPHSPVLSRPQEDADSYDFIIKVPDQDIINDTERFVNRFLRRAWSSSDQPNTQQRRLAGELLSPLIYHRHQVNNGIDDDVHVAVAVRLRDPVDGDFMTEVTTLCDYLHSPKGRKEQLCKEISDCDILGLDPVPGTTFLICWDSAFLYNLLENTIPTVQSTMDGLRRVMEKAVRVNWVRIGCFLFMYYFTRRPGEPGLVRTATAAMSSLPTKELQRQAFFIGETVGEILHLLATFNRTITVMPTVWQRQVGSAKEKLDNVCRKLQAGAASVVMDPTFTKESFFTYREALDSFSNVILCNKELWTMYSQRTMKWSFATVTSASGAGVAFYSIRGMAQRGAMFWPVVGTIVVATAATVAAVCSAIEGLGNHEKATWCKQVDTCLQVCSDSVRDCEQLMGYLYLFHNRGQESLFYRDSSQEDMVEKFLNEIQEKTGRDPRQEDFVRSGGYQAILRDRGEALQDAIAKYEGIFTKISTMSS